MKQKEVFLLWLGGLLIYLGIAKFQTSPGYMDSEYYYVTAQEIFAGKGFVEPFIWNYLNNPSPIPAPSHLYWMPLTSLLAYLGMLVGKSSTWLWGRMPFILLASLISPWTYSLSWKLTQKHTTSLFAGMMALFPGFYTAYLATTDTFALSMFLGCGWILITQKALQKSGIWIFLAGMFSGLLHFSRADGLVWLVLCSGFGLWECYRAHAPISRYLQWIILPLGGYLIIMGGWYYRNWELFQAFFPPGNQRTLWLRNYNDLFSYPPERLNFSYWWQNGLILNLKDRLYSSGQNLLTFIAVEGEIFLSALILIGAWGYRSKIISKLIWIPWLALFFLMSLIFPYAGYRGGFFHASAAFQPFFWIFSGVGFERFLDWGNLVRHWNKAQSRRIFYWAGIILAFSFTMLVTTQRVIGNSWEKPLWNESQRFYSQLCSKVDFSNNTENKAVLVNNPVGFYLVCKKNALAIPVGGVNAVKQVAQKYGAEWLILEENHPPEIDQYYFFPQDFDGFHLLENEQTWKIYQFIR